MNTRKYHLVWFGILVVVSLFFVMGGNAYNQEIEFEKILIERLREQNIPVKSIDIIGQDPYQLEVILQSSSNETKIASDDPAYIHAVQRETALLYDEQNLNIDVIRISVLNESTADVLFWGEFAITAIPRKVQSTNSVINVSRQMEDWVVDHYLNSKNTNISLEKLELSTDEYGQMIVMEISTPTIISANAALPDIMTNQWRMIEEIKDEYDLNPSILKIRLFNEEGNILLDYTLDLQLKQENWWMDDGLTTEWFPHPLPPDGS
ncbi:MAG TPA: hypothetical protein EYH05_08430 [Anaerolineae bacterium]|nr:hypothetical protein [Anaerolineae bacterium]